MLPQNIQTPITDLVPEEIFSRCREIILCRSRIKIGKTAISAAPIAQARTQYLVYTGLYVRTSRCLGGGCAVAGWESGRWRLQDYAVAAEGFDVAVGDCRLLPRTESVCCGALATRAAVA